MNDLDDLMAKAMEALRRDLNHIFTASSSKKLDASSARDLVAYLKFMVEQADLKAKAVKALEKMPEEELKKLAKELLETKS